MELLPVGPKLKTFFVVVTDLGGRIGIDDRVEFYGPNIYGLS